MSEKLIRICPRCRSTDIHADLSTQAYIRGFNEHICNKCGYTGQFFPAVDEKHIKE
tara:strand:- start:2163 stop:2330 length:168 start_codon:yes stop_codon:yes gene_type:complete